MRRKPAMLLVVAAVLGLIAAAPNKEDLLWQYRNRGKAFYENPTTQAQAVDEFKKALDLAPNSIRERLNYGLALLRAGRTAEAITELKKVRQQDPKLPHTWFNLGIVYKKAGEMEQAAAMFERMGQLAPDDAVTQYNLGVLYKLQDKLPAAMERFENAARLDPSLAAPRFQLYNVYRLSGKREEAMKQLAQFQALKKAQEISGNTEDMEWNEYAEIYDPIDPSLSTFDAADSAPPRFTRRKIGPGVSEAQALVWNFDNGARADLLVWGAFGGGRLYRGGVTSVQAPQLAPGRAFFAGDADNDGFADLCMLTAAGAELLWNRRGSLEKAPHPLAEGAFSKAIWVDYDHDYDLDLLLLGRKTVLLRNQGGGGFVDRGSALPFVNAEAVDGVSFRMIPDSKSNDILIAYRDRSAVLYRDRLAGKFEAVPMPLIPPGAAHLRVWDWNHDGALDLAFTAGGKLHLLANQHGAWKEQAAPAVADAAFCDFNNLAVTELCAGGQVYPLIGAPRKMEGLDTPIAIADFNADGRADAVSADPSGTWLHENATPAKNRWFSVKLDGVKNLKLGSGAEVEIKAGRRYQKKLYEGYPLLFGMRGYALIDTVRITWPNGLIQNEPRQAVGRIAEYKEAQRLSGSCPMIYTWNGREFSFLTDVLGVAPLGASSGDGKYFPTDHDEYVSIPGEALRARDGYYDLRITEELGEVTYLDHLKLIALDHPADVEIYSNDKWKSPPYPDFRLYQTQRRVYPLRARDGKGTDVLARIRALDRVYADTFRRTMRNTAETHSIELDFGPAAPNQGAFLVLTGWVDWADGSTFLKESQEPGKALVPPYLQVRDRNGEWRTVIEDMGIPSGKTKAIAVDLSGKFLSSSREARIVTNLCVYWDEIFLGVQTAQPRVHMRPIAAAQADLAFHGFSKPLIHPERRQPEMFFYNPAGSTSSWNPTPGRYTRYGDVKMLLESVDDMFVIMGSGDELRVRFSAATPPPQGWKRDFLLYVDGWAKDSDANTAFSQSVEPLPFHGMTQYPYAAPERYPEDTAHKAYQDSYNTRPALRLLRSIAP
ncbi:MAG: tetratricopeptide repeat protein [Bryobacterales bacterium]|nr:tetratricopeptide repeat protein [Bryobacterales bacterium]